MASLSQPPASRLGPNMRTAAHNMFPVDLGEFGTGRGMRGARSRAPGFVCYVFVFFLLYVSSLQQNSTRKKKRRKAALSFLDGAGRFFLPPIIEVISMPTCGWLGASRRAL